MDHKTLSPFVHKLGIKLHPRPDSRGWWQGVCPFAPWRHKRGVDKNPSFGISVSDTKRSTYSCFSCQSSGSLPKLAYELARLTDDEDLVKLGIELEMAEIYGAKDLEIDWDDVYDDGSTKNNPDKNTMWETYPTAFTSDKASSYLRSRGINFFTSLKLGLRWDSHEMRVLFPIFSSRNEFVGFSGRAVNKGASLRVKDYMGLNKRSYMLGEHTLYDLSGRGIQKNKLPKPFDTAYFIVEGLFDYAKLVSLGVHRCLCMLGTSVTYEKFSSLIEAAPTVVWMMDNDLAGMQVLYGHYNRELADGPISPRSQAFDEKEKGMLFRYRNYGMQYTVRWPKDLGDPGDIKNKQQLLKLLSKSRLY